MNQDQFLLDSGFWGWLYKLLYPVEWLMTQIMAGFHRFMVMLGMNEIGFSWVMSIVFLVIVVQACVFPLFYKSMKGMRKMQAQMAASQESVEAQEFTASVGGGVVEAKVNGKKEVLAVTIKPEAVDPEDVEMLQDLVVSAVNEALRQAGEAMDKSIEQATGGLDLGAFGL